MPMTRLTCAFLLGLVAAPLGAHPHVWVDTAMRFEVNDDAEITGVTMTWAYDDFFTLLIFEDMGLDADGDAVLTDAELETLFGFDLEHWPEGFEGDLYLYSNGDKITMPRPHAIGIAVEDGKIVATHFREIPPVPVEGLEVMQYDPTYFVSYDVSQGVSFNDPNCSAVVADYDPTVAEAALADALQNPSEDIFLEIEMGIYYADRINISCASQSN